MFFFYYLNPSTLTWQYSALAQCTELKVTRVQMVWAVQSDCQKKPQIALACVHVYFKNK